MKSKKPDLVSGRLNRSAKPEQASTPSPAARTNYGVDRLGISRNSTITDAMDRAAVDEIQPSPVGDDTPKSSEHAARPGSRVFVIHDDPLPSLVDMTMQGARPSPAAGPIPQEIQALQTPRQRATRQPLCGTAFQAVRALAGKAEPRNGSGGSSNFSPARTPARSRVKLLLVGACVAIVAAILIRWSLSEDAPLPARANAYDATGGVQPGAGAISSDANAAPRAGDVRLDAKAIPDGVKATAGRSSLPRDVSRRLDVYAIDARLAIVELGGAIPSIRELVSPLSRCVVASPANNASATAGASASQPAVTFKYRELRRDSG